MAKNGKWFGKNKEPEVTSYSKRPMPAKPVVIDENIDDLDISKVLDNWGFSNPIQDVLTHAIGNENFIEEKVVQPVEEVEPISAEVNKPEPKVDVPLTVLLQGHEDEYIAQQMQIATEQENNAETTVIEQSDSIAEVLPSENINITENKSETVENTSPKPVGNSHKELGNFGIGDPQNSIITPKVETPPVENNNLPQMESLASMMGGSPPVDSGSADKPAENRTLGTPAENNNVPQMESLASMMGGSSPVDNTIADKPAESLASMLGTPAENGNVPQTESLASMMGGSSPVDNTSTDKPAENRTLGTPAENNNLPQMESLASMMGGTSPVDNIGADKPAGSLASMLGTPAENGNVPQTESLASMMGGSSPVDNTSADKPAESLASMLGTPAENNNLPQTESLASMMGGTSPVDSGSADKPAENRTFGTPAENNNLPQTESLASMMGGTSPVDNTSADKPTENRTLGTPAENCNVPQMESLASMMGGSSPVDNTSTDKPVENRTLGTPAENNNVPQTESLASMMGGSSPVDNISADKPAESLASMLGTPAENGNVPQMESLASMMGGSSPVDSGSTDKPAESLASMLGTPAENNNLPQMESLASMMGGSSPVDNISADKPAESLASMLGAPAENNNLPQMESLASMMGGSSPVDNTSTDKPAESLASMLGTPAENNNLTQMESLASMMGGSSPVDNTNTDKPAESLASMLGAPAENNNLPQMESLASMMGGTSPVDNTSTDKPAENRTLGTTAENGNVPEMESLASMMGGTSPVDNTSADKPVENRTLGTPAENNNVPQMESLASMMGGSSPVDNISADKPAENTENVVAEEALPENITGLLTQPKVDEIVVNMTGDIGATGSTEHIVNGILTQPKVDEIVVNMTGDIGATGSTEHIVNEILTQPKVDEIVVNVTGDIGATGSTEHIVNGILTQPKVDEIVVNVTGDIGATGSTEHIVNGILTQPKVDEIVVNMTGDIGAVGGTEHITNGILTQNKIDEIVVNMTGDNTATGDAPSARGILSQNKIDEIVVNMTGDSTATGDASSARGILTQNKIDEIVVNMTGDSTATGDAPSARGILSQNKIDEIVVNMTGDSTATGDTPSSRGILSQNKIDEIVVNMTGDITATGDLMGASGILSQNAIDSMFAEMQAKYSVTTTAEATEVENVDSVEINIPEVDMFAVLIEDTANLEIVQKNSDKQQELPLTEFLRKEMATSSEVEGGEIVAIGDNSNGEVRLSDLIRNASSNGEMKLSEIIHKTVPLSEKAQNAEKPTLSKSTSGQGTHGLGGTGVFSASDYQEGDVLFGDDGPKVVRPISSDAPPVYTAPIDFVDMPASIDGPKIVRPITQPLEDEIKLSDLLKSGSSSKEVKLTDIIQKEQKISSDIPKPAPRKVPDTTRTLERKPQPTIVEQTPVKPVEEVKYSGNESLFDLNIEQVLEHWGNEHAIREIIANGLDEQNLTNSKEIKIFKDQDTWHIRDFGRGITFNSFTQNENAEKLASPNLIGKFGVGLKDSLAVFHRRGVAVEINSKHANITLRMSKKAGFDINTLHALFRAPKNSKMEGTDFAITGISDGDMAIAKDMFLIFSDAEKLESTKYGDVLHSNDSKPKGIYVNGVKVAGEDKFMFNYNITNVNTKIKKAMNRERTNVGRTAYTETVKNILLNCSSYKVMRVLVEDLQNVTKGTSRDETAWVDVAVHAAKTLNDSNNVVFMTADGRASLTNPQVDILRESGKSVIIVTNNVYDKIKSEAMTFNDLLEEYRKSFTYNFVDECMLTTMEKEVFDLKNNVVLFLQKRQYNTKVEVKISETIKSDFHGNETLSVYEQEQNSIIIKRSVLSDSALFLGMLTNEYVHFFSKCEESTKEFEKELTLLLGKVLQETIDGIEPEKPKRSKFDFFG